MVDSQSGLGCFFSTCVCAEVGGVGFIRRHGASNVHGRVPLQPQVLMGSRGQRRRGRWAGLVAWAAV